MQLVINEKNIILTQHGDEQDISGKYPESIKIFWVSDTEKYENGQEFLPDQAAAEAHHKKQIEIRLRKASPLFFQAFLANGGSLPNLTSWKEELKK